MYKNDKLQQLFPDTPLGRREIIWLWCKYKPPSLPDHLGDHLNGFMREKLALYLSGWIGAVDQLTKQLSFSFLAERYFDWIEKENRQANWVLQKLLLMRGSTVDTPLLPTDLEQKEQLVLLFDLSLDSYSEKLETLEQLKEAWNQQHQQDKQLAWYSSAGKENEKLSIAWQWYQDVHNHEAKRTPRFAKSDDLLLFLDSTSFSLEEKLHHLSEIKKKFKALQVAANRKGKQQTNLSISSETRKMLEKLSTKHRMTKTDIVELLIQHAHERGMLN